MQAICSLLAPNRGSSTARAPARCQNGRLRIGGVVQCILWTIEAQLGERNPRMSSAVKCLTRLGELRSQLGAHADDLAALPGKTTAMFPCIDILRYVLTRAPEIENLLGLLGGLPHTSAAAAPRESDPKPGRPSPNRG